MTIIPVQFDGSGKPTFFHSGRVYTTVEGISQMANGSEVGSVSQTANGRKRVLVAEILGGRSISGIITAAFGTACIVQSKLALAKRLTLAK